MTMLRGVLAALSLVAPAVGAAPLVDRVQLAAGPYLADSALDVGLSLDPAALPDNVPSGPTDGRLVERGRSLRWEVSAALGESHAFRFGGFRVAGTAEGSTTRLLEDEGRPVVVDARARGDLALSAHGASWAWWLARDDERAWGIGLGLVRYALRTRVEGRLVVDGGPPGEGEARYAVDAIAPLLHIEYRRRLGLGAQAAGGAQRRCDRSVARRGVAAAPALRARPALRRVRPRPALRAARRHRPARHPQPRPAVAGRQALVTVGRRHWARRSLSTPGSGSASRSNPL